MKNMILFIVTMIMILSCSKEDKIDATRFIGEYELKSCFTDTNFYSESEGGCQITQKGSQINIEFSITKNSYESVSFKGYIDGDKVKKREGDIFGNIWTGKLGIYIDQTDGTTYEFWKDSYINSGSISSGRCQATTQKGTQCKRKASKGSIYCWQHK